MPTRRPRRRNLRNTLSILLTTTVLAGGLTACGVGAENDRGETGGAEETSFDAALENFNDRVDGGDGDLPDPRSLEGVSTAETVGDVTPVSGEVEPDLPVELTDSDGNDVTVDDVSRIIPLDIYGTISRTLAGLGLRDNIVGRTVSSLEPSLEDLPVVTQGGHSINAEAVLNLNPSLVIVDGAHHRHRRRGHRHAGVDRRPAGRGRTTLRARRGRDRRRRRGDPDRGPRGAAAHGVPLRPRRRRGVLHPGAR